MISQHDLLTHLCRIYFPIIINWTSPFPNLGLLGGTFHFYSNFKRNFCKQRVENLIRRRVLWRLIWFCTVCKGPTKRTLGLYRLNFLPVSGIFCRLRITFANRSNGSPKIIFSKVIFKKIRRRQKRGIRG